jgi:geranylgeranyl reductase family protein
MTKRRWDVIVVGAGPAGTTAARHCALKGLDTLVIEKEVFPRDKPCGGAVSEWALSVLGLDLPPQIVEQECSGARIFFRNHSAQASKPFRIGILVSRATFDAFLLQKARDSGATVLPATRANDFQTQADDVEVLTDDGPFSAQCLIIAEGAMGRMAQKIRGPYGKQGTALTMVTEVESSQDEIEKRTGGRIQIHFDVAYRGYGWIFPHRGYYSVGFGGIRGGVTKPADLLRNFLVRQGFYGKQKLRGCFLPVGGVPRPVARDRVVLVGDAAGFVDAFTGEGIGYAILSGKLAAETIHDTLSQRHVPGIDLSLFQDRCHRHFGARLRYANYTSRILHGLPDIFLRAFSTYPEVPDRLLELATWRASYRAFLFWFLARTPRYLWSRFSNFS